MQTWGTTKAIASLAYLTNRVDNEIIHNMPKPKTPTMTGALRRKLRECGIPLLKLQAETGVERASLSRFIRGQCSLRLDIADKLALYFKLHLVEREN